jgi:hypothetical protein
MFKLSLRLCSVRVTVQPCYLILLGVHDIIDLLGSAKGVVEGNEAMSVSL